MFCLEPPRVVICHLIGFLLSWENLMAGGGKSSQLMSGMTNHATMICRWVMK